MKQEVVQVTKIVRQERVNEVEQVSDNVPTTDCSCWDGMDADPDCMECDGSGLLFLEVGAGAERSRSRSCSPRNSEVRRS